MNQHITGKNAPKASHGNKMERIASEKSLEVTNRLYNPHTCTKSNCGCKQKEATTKAINKSVTKGQNALISPKSNRLQAKLSINSQERSDSQSTVHAITPRQSIQNPEKFKQVMKEFSAAILDEQQGNDKQFQQKNSTGPQNSQEDRIQQNLSERNRKLSSVSLKSEQKKLTQIKELSMNEKQVSLVNAQTQTLALEQIRDYRNDKIQQLEKEIFKKNKEAIDHQARIQELMSQLSKLRADNQQLKQRQKQYQQKLQEIEWILDPESFSSDQQ